MNHIDRIILILSIGLLPFILFSMVGQLYAVELRILESQLNKNSITGVLQNPHNYTVGSIMVRAEFYDKEDGHLVGLRDFYEVSKDQLKPNEKSSFKVFEHAGETQEFPKTEFIVKAEGEDYTGMREISAAEQIKQIEDLGNALKNLPDEVVINVMEYPNGTKQIVNKTVIYKNDSDDTP